MGSAWCNATETPKPSAINASSSTPIAHFRARCLRQNPTFFAITTHTSLRPFSQASSRKDQSLFRWMRDLA
jgi:hypothetical protein